MPHQRAICVVLSLAFVGCRSNTEPPDPGEDASELDFDGDGLSVDEGDCDDANDDVGAGSNWFADEDGDGFGDPSTADLACEAPDGYIATSGDCDDTDPDRNPDTPWWQDADADGFGNGALQITQCDDPDGYVANDDDCDDGRSDAFPGGIEVAYDGADNDCDPSTLDDDLDLDGHDQGLDCDDDDPDIGPHVDETPYDGIDNDCRPATPDDDLDGDGFLVLDDCDDLDAAVRPGTMERLGDAVDQDCDGGADSQPWRPATAVGYELAGARTPVLTANAHHVLLGVAASHIVRPAPEDPIDDGGIALAFAHNNGRWGDPSREFAWQALNTEPMYDAFDMSGSGDAYHVGFGYQNLSAGGINNNWLFVRENTTSNAGANYAQYLAWSKETPDTVYSSVDLAMGPSGEPHVVACRSGVMHYLGADSFGGPFGEDWMGLHLDSDVGDHCWAEFDGSTPYAHSWSAASGHRTWQVIGKESRGEEAEFVPVSPWYDTGPVHHARAREGVVALSNGPDGLFVATDTSSRQLLDSATTTSGSSYDVQLADAMVHGGSVYIAAVTEDVDGDGIRDVVLAYGPPEGPVVDAHLGLPDLQEAQGVAIWAGSSRVVVAVTTMDDDGDERLWWSWMAK